LRVAIDAMLLGGTHSGVEVAIEGLCAALPEAGGSKHYLIAHRAAYDASRLEGERVDALRAPGWASSRPGRIVWEHMALPGAARRWGARVLHGPGYVIPARWKGPAVVTIYDVLALTHPQWCKWTNVVHYRRMLWASARAADLVVTPSHTVKAQVTDILNVDAANVRVVPLGIHGAMRPVDAEAVARARQTYGLPRRYILWVGNIEPKKNVGAMVRAFEAAASKIPHALVLAGRPAWRARRDLQMIAQSPFASRIKALGYVPADVLPALYTGADLHVHWSLYEGAGLTPLEAMACGTCSVVSDGGALPELAGQHARVVPLGPPANLAEALVDALGHAGPTARCSDAAQAWAQDHTWAQHAGQMNAVYEEVAGLAT